MTSENNRSKGAKSSGSAYVIIQLVFLGLYYLDICHDNPKEKCTTVVPSWPLWTVWLPSIIYTGCIVVFIFLACCCGACGYIFDQYPDNKNPNALLAEVRTDNR